MGQIEEVRFWCYKILPLVYDDSLSYYENICHTVSKLNEVIKATNGFDGLVASVKAELQAAIKTGDDKLAQAISDGDAKLAGQIAETNANLAKSVNDLNAAISGLNTAINGDINNLQAQINILKDWIDNYDTNVVEELIKEILFKYVPSQMTVSLDSTGHLVIDYWEPWDELVFGTTGYDEEIAVQPEFGHLTLRY